MTTGGLHIRQAVFLVGGKGTRLGNITATTPKPLLELADGLSFIDVLIEHTARHGYDRLLLLAGHHGQQFIDRYHGRSIRNARVEVYCEDTPAGTGGALARVADRLDPWFLLLNGDTYFDINLRALAARPPVGKLGRIALRHETGPARYGSVELVGERITKFREKAGIESAAQLVSGGVYLLAREAVGQLPVPSSLETDLFPSLASRGQLAGETFAGYFLDIGLPATYAQARREIPQRRLRPAAFLDRDGVLNVDIGHAHRLDQLRWIAGAKRAVRHLNDAGFYVFVVTNQAGIAKGLYGESEVAAFHAGMQYALAQEGAHIDAFYHCPYHPQAIVPRLRAVDHQDRKPRPGMILRAMSEWPVVRQGSFLIGDMASDIAAAHAAGVAGISFTGGNLHEVVQSLTEDARDFRPASALAMGGGNER